MTHTIGIVGTGVISAASLEIAREPGLFGVKAVTDLDPGRARQLAAEHGTRATTVAELLADPEITAAVNLTPPAAHAGAIGRPVAATAFFMGSGPERWHPSPDFFGQPGHCSTWDRTT